MALRNVSPPTTRVRDLHPRRAAQLLVNGSPAVLAGIPPIRHLLGALAKCSPCPADFAIYIRNLQKHVGSPRRWRTVPPEPGEQTGPGSLPGSRQMANSYDRRLASRCSTERPTSSQRPRPPGSSLQPASNPIVPTFAFTRARRTPVITRVKTTKPARPSNASDTIMSSERFVRRAIRSRGNNREHPAKERRDDSESGCRLARRHTDQYQPRQRIRDPQG